MELGKKPNAPLKKGDCIMGRVALKKSVYYLSVFCTIVLGGVLALAVLAKYINPSSSSFMVVLGLATPALLIANCAAFLYWLCRWKVWAVIPILAIAANWGYMSAMYQFGDEKAGEDDEAIRVGTYNVCVFNNDYTGYSAKEIVDFLKENKVDVFCMQEYGSQGNFTTDSVDSIFSQVLKFSYAPRVDKKNGLAVYSNYPIIKHGYIPFRNSPNSALWCDIVKGNDTVRIFNAHFQTTNVSRIMRKADKGKELAGGLAGSLENSATENAEKRAQQALYVRKLMKQSELPVFLCGDFNDTPASFTYQVFNEFLTDGFKKGGNGYGATYRYYGKVFRIDYIFVDKNFDVRNYHTLDKDLSDHKPVIADLKLQR